MKKLLLPLSLCAILAFGTVAYADVGSADKTIQQETDNGTNIPVRQLNYVKINNIISDKNTGEISYIVTSDMENKTVNYCIAKDTVLIDYTGKALNLRELNNIDEAYIFGGNVTLNTNPKQVYAEAIVVNMPMDAGCPILHTVEAVKNQGDSLQITTDNGGLHLFVKKDIPTSLIGSSMPYKASDVKIGDRIFAWYDIVMESYPAQAHPAQLVVIPSANNTLSLVLNGKDLGMKGVMDNGTAYIPLRLSAESLGCKISWDSKTRKVKLYNDARAMTITEGEDLYASYSANPAMSGMTAPKKLGKSYIDKDGVMYVPGEIFSVLVGYEVSLNGYTLKIDKK